MGKNKQRKVKVTKCYKEWTYQHVIYYPFTPKEGGEITWKRTSVFKEVMIPCHIKDPEKYLWNSALDNDAIDHFFFIT